MRLALPLCLSALLASPVGPGPRQDQFETIRRHLDAPVSSPVSLPDCTTLNGSLSRLCEGLQSTLRAEGTLEPTDADKARTQLERVVDEQPKWALGWYALGRARLAAAHAGLVGREGPLQVQGMSNYSGASAALDRALSIDATLTPAATLLASAPVPFTDKKALKARVASLRSYRSALTPSALVDAAFFELDAGSADTAVKLLQVALNTGGEGFPRGYAQITSARALYRVGKTKEGRQALIAGAAETDSAGLAEYQNQIAWVGDSTEMKTWAELSPNARTAWLTAFWSKRDVKDGRKDGDRLIEHYRRVNYAYEHYRWVLPFSGQQKVLLSPNESSVQETLRNKPRVLGANVYGPDIARLIADYASARLSYGAENPHRTFETHQNILDDRGLMYIRHGTPSAMLERTGATLEYDQPDTGLILGPNGIRVGPVRELNTIEVWRYDRQTPAPPLILYFMNYPFQGSVEANTLVPTLMAEDAVMRNKLCSIDLSICPAGTDLIREISERRVTPEIILDSRNRGLATIREAVTSDAFPLAFAKAVHPSIETHLLDLAKGGSQRLIVAFAIPGDELVRDSTPSGFRYSVTVTAMAVRISDGKRIDIATSRQLNTDHLLTGKEFFSGLIELPLPPGIWTSTTVLTQADMRGAKISLPPLPVTEMTTKLSIGDLVLGRDESGVKWNSGPGGQDVALNPLSAFPAGSSAKLYAQISGLNPGESYRIGIEVFEGSQAKGDPAIKLEVPALANASRAELAQTLGLSNLRAGKYIVRVTVIAGGQSAMTTGGLEIR